MNLFKPFLFSVVIVASGIVSLNAMKGIGTDLMDLDAYLAQQEELENLVKTDVVQARQMFKDIFDHAVILSTAGSFKWGSYQGVKSLVEKLPIGSYGSMALCLAYAKVHQKNVCKACYGQSQKIHRDIAKISESGKETQYSSTTTLEPKHEILDYVAFIDDIGQWVNFSALRDLERTPPFFDQQWLPLVLPFIPFLVKNPVVWLCLTYVGLKELPDEIGLLQDLTHLFVENNCLTTLPDSIAFLTKLRGLIADENNFSQRPAVLDQMPALQECKF